MLIDIVMREADLFEPKELLRLSARDIIWMQGKGHMEVPYTEWGSFHTDFYMESLPVAWPMWRTCYPSTHLARTLASYDIGEVTVVELEARLGPDGTFVSYSSDRDQRGEAHDVIERLLRVVY